jgi:hypothetical protein
LTKKLGPRESETELVCPHCENARPAEPKEIGAQEYVEDCPSCHRPYAFSASRLIRTFPVVDNRILRGD